MRRLVLPGLLVCSLLAAVAFSGPIAQAVKAFSAGKAGEIHGFIDMPTAQGAQGLEVYLPGRLFSARLAKSGEFTLNYVPPGSYTLVVASRSGQVLHTESGVTVAMHGVTEVGTIAILSDSDGDGFTVDQDCDDLNAAVYPGAVEVEDGLDNDCDGLVDEGYASWTDADSDGYPAQAGWAIPVDCDDTLASVHPGAQEVCDGLDNDCDGLVDEDFDLDGDGYTTCDGDCDDSDPTIHPDATDDTPDGIDNDCDGWVDEGADTDGDGFTFLDGDCDPLDDSVYPGAPDLIDDLDNDCDGHVDEHELVFHQNPYTWRWGYVVQISYEARFEDIDNQVDWGSLQFFINVPGKGTLPVQIKGPVSPWGASLILPSALDAGYYTGEAWIYVYYGFLDQGPIPLGSISVRP